jgi:hypothetical protein
VLRSTPLRSMTCCGIYLAIVILITTVAFSKGLCGDGDSRPPCGGFAFDVSLYGALGIGAIVTVMVLVGIVLRRHVSALLKTSAIVYATSLLSFVLPLRAAGNKLAGAIVVMMVLPIISCF